MITTDISGTIFNIQKFSVHDGPGIRTTVFFKGCPLSCKWCSNAESMNPQPELGIIRERCNLCGECITVCKPRVLSKDDDRIIIDREVCNACGECVKVCPANAIIKRENDGIVVVDRDKCIGKDECNSKCLKVCPWDAPQFINELNAKMQKCDLCLNRLEKGQQAICVDACPMYALDVGPLEKLRETYGNNVEAEGFLNNTRIKPSIILKYKKVIKIP